MATNTVTNWFGNIVSDPSVVVDANSVQDPKTLLSCSYDGTVMTLDPVSTANPGWEDYLAAYKQFCINLNGKLRFNRVQACPLQSCRSLRGRVESPSRQRACSMTLRTGC